MSSLKLETLSL